MGLGNIELKPGFKIFSFEKGIKDDIEKRLSSCGFEFKPDDWFKLTKIEYRKGPTIGSVDLRRVYLEKGPYHLFFIFHESYLETKGD